MLPDDIPRCEFYHWVVVDLPLSVRGDRGGALFIPLPQDGRRGAHGGGAATAALGYNDYADMPELSGAAVGQR